MAGGSSDVGRLPSGRPGGLLGHLPATKTPAGALHQKAFPLPRLQNKVAGVDNMPKIMGFQCVCVTSCGHSYADQGGRCRSGTEKG